MIAYFDTYWSRKMKMTGENYFKFAVDTPVCGCCKSRKSKAIGFKRKWSLRQCLNCGVIYVSPQPTAQQLNEIYSLEKGYFATSCVSLAETSDNDARRLDQILRANGVDGGRLLDIGCATGRVIYHMKSFGWDAAGIDVNAQAIDFARTQGLEVYAGPLNSMRDNKSNFDAINMGDVIEHAVSPTDMLQSAYSLLRPGGILIVRTPNAECGFARLTLSPARYMRVPWPHSEAPYHLWEFSASSLTAVLLRNGFKIISSDCTGRFPFMYIVGASGYFDELKMSMKKSGKYRLNRYVITQIPKLIGISAGFYPFYFLGRTFDKMRKNGSVLTIIAKKN